MTMVMDVAILGDQGSILQAVEDNEKHSEKLAVKLKLAVTSVQDHFKSRPPSAKAKAFDKDVVAREKRKLPVSKVRWFLGADKDGVRHIDNWRPKTSKVVVDQPNGRYLCTYPGIDRKSFSWSKRGQAAAVLEVLRWLWSEHEKATGTELPFPEDFLEPPVVEA